LAVADCHRARGCIPVPPVSTCPDPDDDEVGEKDIDVVLKFAGF
jgi:hypothetical protein